MNICNSYLTYVTKTGENKKVSISDILHSGVPIDEDDGEDLELSSDEIEKGGD